MDYYEKVNSAWPVTLPSITRAEGARAARKLIHHFHRRRKVRWSRRCWIAVTPEANTLHRGWRRLVHDVSHRVFDLTHPNSTNHGGLHAKLEQAMVEYVVAQGWLGGPLRPAQVRSRAVPSPADKLARVRASMKRWLTKKKRAETALSTLRRRERYYEKRAVPAIGAA